MENKTLPIFQFKSEIVKAIKDNPVTVITAETGAGKSTQVPQYLLEQGYNLVVTQPRRLAARTVAQRVAEEFGEKLGGVVGYRTAVDRQDSPTTRCLFCTDGLALIRELMGQNKGVLVLDEVHEWNENMEVLVAWAKRQIKAGGVDFKVIVMSATMESEKLSAYFDNAPVISVSGRLFPVEVKTAGINLESDVATLVSEGHNVLVFQPGKQEISDTVDALVRMQVGAEILQLHGELTPEDQARCFRHYSRPKVVVSTNVAQTSVTIDDIDAVVDGGMERRIELVDGVEGLYLKPISRADATQRKGRAGRTKTGIYIDHCKTTSRPDFPVAEIMRKRLDQTVLRLAIAGFDMAEMEFFHQPAKSEIASAKSALISLGCMTATGEVTRIGKLVNRLPVSVQYARMLIEADRLGVVDDVLTVAAILEQGGITVLPPSRNKPDRPDWRRMVPDEHESDVMGQLAVYEMAGSMTKGEMFEKGVALKSYYRAKEIRHHISQALKQYFRFGSTGRREDILKSVCAGMVDHLYQGAYGTYRNGDSVSRQLGTASLVRNGSWLVGKPFDLEIKTRKGSMTLNLIELASSVDPMWLTEVAPQLVQIEEGLSPYFDGEQDSCFSTTKTHFNGQVVKEEKVSTPEHEKATDVFADWLAGQMASGKTGVYGGHVGDKLVAVVETNTAVQKEAHKLNIRAGSEILKIMSRSEWRDWLVRRINGARCAMEVVDFDSLQLPELDQELAQLVITENPDDVEVFGLQFPMAYRSGYAPQIVLEGEMVEKKEWLRLPDAGIILPGGRAVEVKVILSSGWNSSSLADSNIPALKEKVRNYLNRKVWEAWVKPEITLADLADDQAQIPEIATVQYGTCAVDGSTLLAFGTLVVNNRRYYTNDPFFKGEWCRSREESEAARAKAVQKLEEVRVEARQQAELVVAKAEAEQVRESFTAICNKYCYGQELSPELRAKLAEWRYVTPSTSMEDVRKFTVFISAIIVEVEAELSEIARAKAEEAADLDRSVAAGKILVNFEAWHRRGGMSGNGEGWVIQPDGSLRNHDSNDIRRHKSDGNYCWNYVSEDELALKWSCGTMRDIAGSSEFIVAKMPTGGITKAQREAVRRIELEDIGTTENSFGLDPEAVERQAKAIAEVAKAFPTCPACGEAIVIDENFYRSLTGEYGIHICQDDHKVSRLVSYGKPFDQSTEGRDAQVIASKRISNGVIEALAYEKWGGWNLNLRWRKITEEEATEPEPMEEVIQDNGTFAEAGGRHFCCPQGHTLRVTKSEWKAYEAGEAVSVACSVCGASGIVQKTIEAKAKAEAGNGGLDLSQLKAVWGSR